MRGSFEGEASIYYRVREYSIRYNNEGFSDEYEAPVTYSAPTKKFGTMDAAAGADNSVHIVYCEGATESDYGHVWLDVVDPNDYSVSSPVELTDTDSGSEPDIRFGT